MRIPVIGLLSAMLAVTGCAGLEDDYSEYHHLPAGRWVYGDTFTYTPEHHNSLCPGRLAVAVRHDVTYPYTDLWLEVTSVDEAQIQRRDTLHYTLTDHYGNWAGQGIAASFQIADTTPSLRHPTGIPVTVRHIMRVDTLRGIHQVGLFFIPDK